MAGKQIRVLTPQTTNGTELLIGDDDKIVYKETILAAGARKVLENHNRTLPKSLQHKIEDYTPEVPEAPGPKTQTPKPGAGKGVAAKPPKPLATKTPEKVNENDNSEL